MVAESLTDRELAEQIQEEEEEEELARQREQKVSEALALQLAQEEEQKLQESHKAADDAQLAQASSPSPSSRAGTATSSSSPSPPSRANACAKRASEGSEAHDEGGRTGVGSKGKETADVRDGKGHDQTKRQRLSYKASVVCSLTPPAPAHHDTPPDEADGRQGASDRDRTQGIVVDATSDAALLASVTGACVTDAEAALKMFDDMQDLACNWLLAESEEKKKLEHEHEQRRRREQDDLKMALSLQEQEQKPESRRKEEADEKASDDYDDVIIVIDSPPPASQSCADGGAGASSGNANGGMGRGQQKKKHDDCTKDDGKSNRRSTIQRSTSRVVHVWDGPHMDKRPTRGLSRGNKFKCETRPKNAPPETFNSCIPTHFTKPEEQDEEHTRDKVDMLLKILLDYLHKANPTDKGIELLERSNRQNQGYTSDNGFTGPDEKKQNYKHIGENRS